jgi:23S rRNA (cytosine1962-C5)-methyltransferase
VRKIRVTKGGLSKIKSGQFELKISDLETSIKSCHPGEWVIFNHDAEEALGFVNPTIDEKFSCAYVILRAQKTWESVEEAISHLINDAYQRRLLFKNYELGSRLFYGIKDGLPGLIIDLFENCCVVQVNTAGIDLYREYIKKYVYSLTKKSVYFLDNPIYRAKENLPQYENEIVSQLDVREQDLKFKITGDVLQKIGFYYDHRENRIQLRHVLSKLNKNYQTGVDLFCYAGAWGISALKANVENVDFVDQGNFEETIKTNLKINGFEGKGRFFRQNVFNFLDQKITDSFKYDVILCDPPAFTKNLGQKKEALEGYTKLHRKVFKISDKNALCCFSSCTHYIPIEEFESNIVDAAKKENRKIQLLYTGIQGWDHPISSLSEKSNYIKSLFFLVE